MKFKKIEGKLVRVDKTEEELKKEREEQHKKHLERERKRREIIREKNAHLSKLSPEDRKIEEEGINLEKAKRRFWSYVGEPDTNGCRNWFGMLRSDMRGYFSYKGEMILAHRFAYIQKYGKIPEDTPFVCHKCDNPSCVNPEHLFVCTRQDNTDDMRAKGREKYSHRGETHWKHRWSDKIVGQIREEYAKGNITYDTIVKKYGVPKTTVAKIIGNKSWKDDNYSPAIVYHGRGELNTNSKLTWKEVNDIREKYKNGKSITELSVECEVVYHTIYFIVKNRHWKDDEYQKWLDCKKP